MSLDLDKRQRAMLSEMGIKLWQPASTKAAEPALVQAAVQISAGPEAPPSTPTAVSSPAASQATVDAPHHTDANAEPMWQVGQLQPVYPKLAPSEQASAIRWLVLAEVPSDAAQALDGDAGQLLDNMLRAAGMHRDADLQFVPVQRGRSDDAGGSPLQDQLTALIQAHRPSIVLVMGRLAAHALLPSDEPFAKRRGKPLSLADCPLLLTYDATYLLRNLPEKARAWEDLCLARVMAKAQ